MEDGCIYIEKQIVKSGISEIPQDSVAHKYFIQDGEEAKYIKGETIAIDDISNSDLQGHFLEDLQNFQVKATLTIPILFKKTSFLCTMYSKGC